MSHVLLASYEYIVNPVKDMSEDKLKAALEQCLALGRFKEAQPIAKALGTSAAWQAIVDAALFRYDTVTASSVYRHLGDAANVMFMQRLAGVEDKRLLAGHIATLQRDYSEAQNCFLGSSHPAAALELRKNLLQWDQALSLVTLAPEEMPIIAREYALQLEFKGQYSESLKMFKQAIATANTNSSTNKNAEHRRVCVAGVMRNCFRLGDIATGMRLLDEKTDRLQLLECGTILASLKQSVEAGMLFERGQYFDKAAEIYLQSKKHSHDSVLILPEAKNYAKVTELLPHIASSKIHTQFAKAKEAEGDYAIALKAYERAKDYDSVVRILLKHLQNLHDAVRVVHEHRNSDGAKMIAAFFQKNKNYKSAVEFYLVANMKYEAFSLAQAHNEMQHYGEVLGESATIDDFKTIALYFEQKGDYILGGKYLMQSGDHDRALDMLLRTPGDSPQLDAAITSAIQTVAQRPDLSPKVLSYIYGEYDQQPKDGKYLIELYMATKDFRSVNLNALLIGQKKIALGGAKDAHDSLWQTVRDLRRAKQHVSVELDKLLMLTHSLLLGRTWLVKKDYLKAARLLLRVAENTRLFPRGT